jgi:hypothetical protein
MEHGEDGPLSMAAPQDVVVEHRQEPDFATILHLQVQGKIVQEYQRKRKSATHKTAPVCFNFFKVYLIISNLMQGPMCVGFKTVIHAWFFLRQFFNCFKLFFCVKGVKLVVSFNN